MLPTRSFSCHSPPKHSSDLSSLPSYLIRISALFAPIPPLPQYIISSLFITLNPHQKLISPPIGGLAGCVVASRLAEADRNLSILVIEQGPNNYNAPEVVHPALYPRNLFPSSKYTMFWQTNKSESLAGRSPIVPSGGTLGGGSVSQSLPSRGRGRFCRCLGSFGGSLGVQ